MHNEIYAKNILSQINFLFFFVMSSLIILLLEMICSTKCYFVLPLCINIKLKELKKMTDKSMAISRRFDYKKDRHSFVSLRKVF